MFRSLGDFHNGGLAPLAKFSRWWGIALVILFAGGLAVQSLPGQPPTLRGRAASTGPAAPPPYPSNLPPQVESLPAATQRLELVRKRSQFMVMRQRVLRFAIADPGVIDIIQYSPTELSIVGLELGSTNLLFWFEGEARPLIYEVAVVPDPSFQVQRRTDYCRLEQKLAILFPESKVHLIPLSGKVVIKGQARNEEQASRILEIVRGEVLHQHAGQPADDAGSQIVNMLDVPDNFQVTLRVQIAELRRSELRRMGLDLGRLICDRRHCDSSGCGHSEGTLAGIFEKAEAAVLLKWLESHGTAEILSEPTLTVLSGHSASFLSGGEFAVPAMGGVPGQSTMFRGFGTSLIVTPTVIDRDRIRMQIVPEFSEANKNLTVAGIPGLNSRRVQTTVELRDGQTIAIAGLISHRTTSTASRIPFLSDLPVISPLLCEKKRAAREECELFVLVTPELVRPMEACEAGPLPSDETTPPSAIPTEIIVPAPADGPTDHPPILAPPPLAPPAATSFHRESVNPPFGGYSKKPPVTSSGR